MLLVICGVNAVSVNDSPSLFGKNNALNSVQIASQQTANSVSSNDIVSDKSSHDSNHNNCAGDDKSCHQCHLGHCHFVLADSCVNIPDPLCSRIGATIEKYTSVDLSTPQRPPLV